MRCDKSRVHGYYILPKISFPPSVPSEITLHVERKHRQEVPKLTIVGYEAYVFIGFYIQLPSY